LAAILKKDPQTQVIVAIGNSARIPLGQDPNLLRFVGFVDQEPGVCRVTRVSKSQLGGHKTRAELLPSIDTIPCTACPETGDTIEGPGSVGSGVAVPVERWQRSPPA